MTLERDIEQLTKTLLNISSVQVPRATSAAINKTTAKAKTRIIRGVSKSKALPQKIIRKKLFVKRSTAKKQRSRLSSYRNAVSVMSLKAKQNKKGVRAQGGRFYQGAFIAKGVGGNLRVFKRESGSRYPIKHMVVNIKDTVDNVMPTVIRRVVKQDYERLLKHELDFRLGKYQ